MKISTKRAFQPAASKSQKEEKKRQVLLETKVEEKQSFSKGHPLAVTAWAKLWTCDRGKRLIPGPQQTHPGGTTLTDNDKIAFSTRCSALPTLSALSLAGKERYMTEQGQDRQKKTPTP